MAIQKAQQAGGSGTQVVVDGVQGTSDDHAAQRLEADEFQLSRHERALRWKNSVASFCMFSVVSASFGASPIVDSMNQRAWQTSDAIGWLAPGVTQPALLQICTQMIVMPLAGSVMKRLAYKGIPIWCTSLLAVLNPISIGLSANTGQAWIQYVGAALAAPAFALGLEFEKVVVVQWWALDGKQCQGLAIQGGMVGLQVTLFSYIMGWACNNWGLAPAAYASGVIIFLFSLWPLWIALRGELGPPPADLAARARKDNTSCAPRRQSTRKELAGTLSFWQVSFHLMSFMFAGFGMKLLLTAVFQAAYSVSFMTSANLATLTLVTYVIARAGFPLIASRVRLLPMMVVMLVLNATLYGSYPLIIQHLSIWWLMVAKTIAGASFAGLLCMQPLLLLEVFGPQDLGVAFVSTAPARCLGFAFGPIVGYYTYLLSSQNGWSEQRAYDPFFYTCAALTAANAINIAVLHVRLTSRQSQELQDLNDKSTSDVSGNDDPGSNV